MKQKIETQSETDEAPIVWRWGRLRVGTDVLEGWVDPGHLWIAVEQSDGSVVAYHVSRSRRIDRKSLDREPVPWREWPDRPSAYRWFLRQAGIVGPGSAEQRVQAMEEVMPGIVDFMAELNGAGLGPVVLEQVRKRKSNLQ